MKVFLCIQPALSALKYNLHLNLIYYLGVIYAKMFAFIPRLKSWAFPLTLVNPFSNKKEIDKEKVADLCHDVWSRWMKYLFEQCENTSFGALLIPADKVKRWITQMLTEYESLSEKEKDSDREIADQYIKLFKELSDKE